jgi:hypothetical protein
MSYKALYIVTCLRHFEALTLAIDVNRGRSILHTVLQHATHRLNIFPEDVKRSSSENISNLFFSFSSVFVLIGRFPIDFVLIGRLPVDFVLIGRLPIGFVLIGRLPIDFVLIGRLPIDFVLIGRLPIDCFDRQTSY